MGWLNLFGSENKSTTSTSQTTNTSNTDNSQMFGDNAVTGSNNAWIDASNRSSTTTFTDSSDRSTTFTDNSDRSTNTETSFSDSSNRSTNFNDSSGSHNVTTTNTNTTITNSDFGSIGAAMSGMGKVSAQVIDLGGASIAGLFDILKFESVQNQKNIDLAFGTAKASQTMAEKTAAQVIGFADSNTAKAKDAFETAAQPEQKKMMYAALAVIAVVGFMALRK
jgi:hypothetical protein